MIPKELEKILEEIPILLVDGIVFKIGKEFYSTPGVAVRKERGDGTFLRYTALDYNCDDLVEGLLHESLHHHYPKFIEETIKILTDYFWDYEEYRDPCQNKIVELCERFDL